MDKVSVVILNYNGRAYLQQFLPSVIQYSDGARIVVVDNASTDDSCSFLEQRYPEIDQIQFSDNLGYAEGYNQALASIEAQYFVLLNSDIEVTENWLAPLIAMMDNDPAIAAVQPRIRSYKNREYFEYAGASGGYIDILGYPFCRGRVFDTTEKDTGQYDDVREVFWTSGACFVIRSERFRQSGGFDPDFFAHMEEIDLCWRLHSAGGRLIVYPESTVFHLGAGTLPVTNPIKTYLNFNNNLAMLTKNLPVAELFFKLSVRLVMDWIAAIKFLFDGTPKHSWAVVKAHLNYLMTLNRTLKKRRAIKMNGKGKIYGGSIVFQYYIMRKRKFGDLKWDH